MAQSLHFSAKTRHVGLDTLNTVVLPVLTLDLVETTGVIAGLVAKQKFHETLVNKIRIEVRQIFSLCCSHSAHRRFILLVNESVVQRSIDFFRLGESTDASKYFTKCVYQSRITLELGIM